MKPCTLIALAVAVVAAAADASSRSELVRQQWATRVATALQDLKDVGAAQLRGLRGEPLEGVEQSLEWLDAYTYPKFEADLNSFSSLVYLDSTRIDGQNVTVGDFMVKWVSNLTSLHKSDLDALRATVDSMAVKFSSTVPLKEVDPVHDAILNAGQNITERLKQEQQADVNLLNQQIAMFNAAAGN